MRQTHSFSEWEMAEDAFGAYAVDHRRKYGEAPPTIGLHPAQAYRVWRRLGNPEVRGGGPEPMYFNILTYGGKSCIVEDTDCGEQEFSVDVPDE